MANATNRIPSIKDRYNLMDEFRKDYPGKVSRDMKSKLSVVCPFHDDHRPSATVYPKYYVCHACDKSGDIIQYVQYRDNCDKNTAIELLSEGMGDRKPIVTVPTASSSTVSDPDYSKLAYLQRIFVQNQELAVPYFKQRGISLEAIKHYGLGVNKKHVWTYTTNDGNKYNFSVPRFTIPNIRHGNILSIKQRRDDASCREHFMSISAKIRTEIYHSVAASINQDVQSVSGDFKYILDACYGAKYLHVSGGSPRLFNSHRVIDASRPTQHIHHSLSYVLVTEGEIDAISLESRGYNAISFAYKEGLNFTYPMHGVHAVYVVADNDKPDKNGIVQGIEKAKRITEIIDAAARNISLFVLPPAPNKDSNDAVVSGAVKNWLAGFAIMPRRIGALV